MCIISDIVKFNRIGRYFFANLKKVNFSKFIKNKEICDLCERL